MAIEKSTLAHNIRFLRKERNLSQEELSNLLDIKRSNIAAYESKNVEPRLRIIMEIAKIFDIDVATLIEIRLTPDSAYKPFNTTNTPSETELNLDIRENGELQDFIEKSIKIRKVLEGFKAFYNFRKNGIEADSPEKEKIIFDIDNFIQLMEHLLNYNENVIKAMSNSSTTIE
ncbi:helix-turn-helix domain-containing protein [Portibacter marinus]|uniref:helix-turn-helix domain-containing protein n=1 Tax=Portibacter marinus TaxID=2898660 RepID=UPI001F26C779|nr:helix-turn-helix domain-containing protein [Portibacter marinus]